MANWEMDIIINMTYGGSYYSRPAWYNSQTIYPGQQAYSPSIQGFLVNCHAYCNRIEWGETAVNGSGSSSTAYNPTYQARIGTTVIQTFNRGSQYGTVVLWGYGYTSNATYCQDCHNFNFYRSGGSIPSFSSLAGELYVRYHFSFPSPVGQIISRIPSKNSTAAALGAFPLHFDTDPIDHSLSIHVGTYWSSTRQVGNSLGSIIYGGQVINAFGTIEDYCR